MNGNIWKSQISAFLSILFVGSFALGALFVVWHVVWDYNPLSDAMAAYVVAGN